jgi:hypothetical protein
MGTEDKYIVYQRAKISFLKFFIPLILLGLDMYGCIAGRRFRYSLVTGKGRVEEEKKRTSHGRNAAEGGREGNTHTHTCSAAVTMRAQPHTDTRKVIVTRARSKCARAASWHIGIDPELRARRLAPGAKAGGVQCRTRKRT